MRSLVLSTLFLAIAACTAPAGLEEARLPLEAVEISFVVPIAPGGFGPTEAGPRSLACLDDGVALLDAAGLKVLRIGADGALLGETSMSVLADDIVALGGGWAFLSTPSRRVVIADADGAIRETIPLPDGLAPVTALGLEDGDLAVTTAYQDRLPLRTPALAAIREGIPCGGGRRCQLVADRAAAPAERRGFRLLVAENPGVAGDGLRFEDGGLLPLEASAARLLGLDGQDLLILSDSVEADGAVRRQLSWLSPELDLVRSADLAVRGGAVPFRQVAICPGGGVSWMEETDEGTRVSISTATHRGGGVR